MPPTMKAPYRSIPISAFVHEPKAPPPSIDHPREDGLCGWLDIEIEVKSDLMIGGLRRSNSNGPTEVSFAETPDGVKAAPGASLRGMLRSVLEIATFGRAAFIDDVRYGLRDLSGSARAIYGSRIVKNEIYAGWLERSGDRVKLRPCRWAQVHVRELAQAGLGGPTDWDHALSVSDRYAKAKSLTPTLHVVAQEQAAFASPAKGSVPKTGTLVFSAKPQSGQSGEKGKKNRELFFYDVVDGEDCLDLGKAWGEFLWLNTWDVGKAEVGGDNRRPGWAYWAPKHAAGERVPVLYIVDEAGEIDAIGTALMFRVAHKHGVHALLDNATVAEKPSRHTDPAVLDVSARLFGPQLDARKIDAFKGRVSVGTATLVGAPAPAKSARAEVLLSNPRGSFFPTMVAQPWIDDGAPDACLKGGTYASYTPVPGGLHQVARPELAGRKRYPSRAEISLYQGPPPAANQRTRLVNPVGPGSKFKGRIRFHNLSREELGALIFAIELWSPCWGERPDLRHRLGMGKPLGLGDVTLTIVDASIEPNALVSGARSRLSGGAARDEWRQAADLFVRDMEEAYAAAKPADGSAWRTSHALQLLFSMSDPRNAKDLDLTYMSLEEHNRAKGARGTDRDRRVLKPYPRTAIVAGDPGSSTDWTAFPRPKAITSQVQQPAPPRPNSATPSQPQAVVRKKLHSTGEIVLVIKLLSRPGVSLVQFEDGEQEEWPVSDLGDL